MVIVYGHRNEVAVDMFHIVAVGNGHSHLGIAHHGASGHPDNKDYGNSKVGIGMVKEGNGTVLDGSNRNIRIILQHGHSVLITDTLPAGRTTLIVKPLSTDQLCRHQHR